MLKKWLWRSHGIINMYLEQNMTAKEYNRYTII